MSLKAELQKWAEALEAYDAQDYTTALAHFEVIADSSKVLFNMGLIHATLGGHTTAIAYYKQAHLLDQYMAVSFFQCAVSAFLLGDYDAACRDLDTALSHMRENQIIDYEQLGLKFKLYSAEILFNMALCMLNMNMQAEGMQFLDRARREKQIPEHSVIDSAFASNGANFTVFSVPVGAVFRPSPVKLKNLESKNYLGRAKVIAATDLNDAFAGFSGVGLLKSRTLLSRERSYTVSDALRRPGGGGDGDIIGASGGGARRGSADDAVRPLNIPPRSKRLPSIDEGVRARSAATAAVRNGSTPLFVPMPPTIPETSSSSGNVPALRTQKSTPNLSGRSPPSAGNMGVPQLPRIDTRNLVRNEAVIGNAMTAAPSGPYSNAVNLSLGTAAAAAPLTPPDSDSGKGGGDDEEGDVNSKRRKRSSSLTQLGYAKSISRETQLMEELLDGYSNAGGDLPSLDAGARRRPPNPPLPEQYRNGARNGSSPPAPQGQPRERVADWAARQQKLSSNSSSGALSAHARSNSASHRKQNSNENANYLAPATAYGGYDTIGGGGGGGGGRSASTRLQRQATSVSRATSNSDYQGGGMGAASIRTIDMISFRVKLHFEDEIRGMSIDTETPFGIFFAKLQAKFGLSDMRLKYKDEDGTFVTIMDDTDWDSAIDAAREHCQPGRQDGKLDIWITELGV